MKNSFGSSVSVTLFGESHGECIGAVIDGIAPGIRVGEDYIRSCLSMRAPSGAISTKRTEPDNFKIVSGVYDGYTTGTPVAIIIPNENVRSADYAKMRTEARPGHADYTGYVKYHGYADTRGGGHFSGRLTAPVVAAGAIARLALAGRGIQIASHIKRCAGVADRAFDDLENDIEKLNSTSFAVLDDGAAEKIRAAIERAASDGDSVGGVLEGVITGVPAGVGEPFFDSAESLLSHALFSIPGIKGVQFGIGFDGADLHGSEYNDPMRMDGTRIVTETNNNGGINGGITNGMPILFSCAVKPTPSIYKEQRTVDFTEGRDVLLSIAGRHDPAIIHRARAVVDAVAAITMLDMMSQRFGTDYFAGEHR